MRKSQNMTNILKNDCFSSFNWHFPGPVVWTGEAKQVYVHCLRGCFPVAEIWDKDKKRLELFQAVCTGILYNTVVFVPRAALCGCVGCALNGRITSKRYVQDIVHSYVYPCICLEDTKCICWCCRASTNRYIGSFCGSRARSDHLQQSHSLVSSDFCSPPLPVGEKQKVAYSLLFPEPSPSQTRCLQNSWLALLLFPVNRDRSFPVVLAYIRIGCDWA